MSHTANADAAAAPASRFKCIVLRESHPLFQEVLRMRIKIFVEEQLFTMEDEIDDKDGHCIHFLLVDALSGAPVGTIRYEPNNSHPFQRLAVNKEYRKTGAGRSLVLAFETYARDQGVHDIVLYAQVRAIPFYLKLGYAAVGEDFMEDGQMHRKMIKTLGQDSPPNTPELIFELDQ